MEAEPACEDVRSPVPRSYVPTLVRAYTLPRAAIPSHPTIAGIRPFAELARGGAAVVYKGYDPERGVVLLKVLTPEAAEDPALVAWLEQEAAAVAAVAHPNVVALYASGREDGRPYLVAEFVEGLSLDAALVAHGALPPELAAYVAAETARGLGAAHAAGVLHRDLKPANVLLGYDGQVKLTDFGLATRIDAVGAAEVRGTPGYLAPEAVRGEAAGPAADLFALGATLAEMLTGRAAFPAPTASAALDAALHHDPLPPLRADPRFPAGLVDVAQELLEKDPAARPSEAARVAADLDTYRAIPGTGFRADAEALASFLADADAYRAARPVAPHVLVAPPPVAEPAPPLSVAPDAVPMPPPRPGRRRGIWVGATALALLVAGALVVTAVRSGREAPDDPAEGDRLAAADSLRLDSAAGMPPLADTLLAELVPDGPQEEEPVEEEPEEEPGPEPEDEPGAEPDVASPPLIPEAADEPPVRTPGTASAAGGTLVVAVQPWARVVVDGREVGEGSLVDVGTLSAGSHRVDLRNPDFPEHSTTVTVAPGEAERLPVSLWALVENLTLRVHPYAEVVIDGRSYGTVPPQRQAILLRPGSHVLELRHPILGTYATTVSAQAGRARTLSFNLLQLLGSENAP